MDQKVKQTEAELKAFGVSLGFMIHELNQPQSVKDILVQTLELLDEEQIFTFAEIIQSAFWRQAAVEQDSGYQASALEADKDTLEALNALSK